MRIDRLPVCTVLAVAFFAVASLPAQTRVFVMRDNNSHTFTWDIGDNLGTSQAISGPILPLNGGTMVGAIQLNGGFGNGVNIKVGSNIEADPDATYHQSLTNCTAPPTWASGTTYALGDIAVYMGTTYTSLIGSNLGNIPSSSPADWVSACVDDRTKIDWFGMEGDFFRIKGKGAGTANANIGDYFDWTRYGSSGVLPLHQVNFNDASFNTLIHIDETNGLSATNFDFSGVVRLGLNTSVDVGIARNAANTLEVNTGTIGSYAQLRILGLLLNQANDSSGYQIQSNGGIEQTSTSGNILSKGTTYNAISAPSGGLFSGIADYFSANASAPSINPPASTGGFSYKSGSTYWYWNGSAWASVDLSASGGPSHWTELSGLLYPTTNTDKVLIQRTADDGSGAPLQVAANGSNNSLNAGGLIQGCGAGTGSAFQGNSGTFIVNCAGAISAHGPLTLATASIPAGITTFTGPLSSWTEFIYQQVAGGFAFVSDANASTNSQMAMYSFSGVQSNGGAIFYGQSVRGTANAPTATQANDNIVSMYGNGYDGTNTSGTAGFDGAFKLFADVNFTTGTHQTSLRFYATPASSTTAGEVMRVTGTGLSVTTGDTIQWNQQAAFRYSGGHVQYSDDGSTWTSFSSGSSQWTLSGLDVYPNSTTYNVLIGANTDDGTTSKFQVAGQTSLTGGLIWSADNSYDIGQSASNRPRSIYAATGIQAPLHRINNGSDYFDLMNTGLGTHAWQLRDSSSNAIWAYANATGIWWDGTLSINMDYKKLDDSGNQIGIWEQIGSGVNAKSRFSVQTDGAGHVIQLDPSRSGSPAIVIDGTPGVTKTCTVLPTVVGGIITSC